METASNMNIKKAKQIIDLVSHVVRHWNDYADQQKVDENLKNAIGKTLLNL